MFAVTVTTEYFAGQRKVAEWTVVMVGTSTVDDTNVG